ncbi:MAG TPA: homoserine dehydrogenase [Synergistetes bacterium]|nr:homoserine dehydrogenase [Synergistota bacterium]
MWKIGMAGFGNVGQGFARILEKKQDSLKDKYGFEYRVTFIADPVKGSLLNPEGLDLKPVLEHIDKKGDLKSHPDATDLDTIQLISAGHADVITEATYTDLKTGEPGVTHIRTALGKGIHVVSTNKGPVSIALPELMELASKNGVSYLFEGVVMSGTPTMNLAREALAGCDITGAMGIVNGTTNYILTMMEEGMAYGEALKKAQELGYAEADPTGDVEGWDAAVKVQVMAKVLIGQPISVEEVDRKGITGITPSDIAKASERGARIKLIAEVGRDGSNLVAKVAPKEVPLTHPLAGIMGATNAITLVTDHLGEVTIVGPGAGRVETGQALLADLLSVHRTHKNS